MGNLPAGFQFRTEFGMDREEADSQGILAKAYYGDAKVVTDRFLYGECEHHPICSSRPYFTACFFDPTVNDMVTSLSNHLNTLANSTEHNWTGIRIVAAFVVAILLAAFIFLTRHLLTTRSKLYKEVQEEKRRPSHLRIEMPDRNPLQQQALHPLQAQMPV